MIPDPFAVSNHRPSTSAASCPFSVAAKSRVYNSDFAERSNAEFHWKYRSTLGIDAARRKRFASRTRLRFSSDVGISDTGNSTKGFLRKEGSLWYVSAIRIAV